MGDSERSVESFTSELLLERLAQKVCALVDPDIRPEQVVVVFGPIFCFGVITCLWTQNDGQSTTYAYFYHADCCPELKNQGQLPKLCIQTIISKSPPFVTTPNEWYEIEGICTENPVAKRIEA